jgi:hypothetical protein
MTAVSFVLAFLRLYTRIHIVRFIGSEDYAFATTVIFLLIFACAIQVAVHYGLGETFWSLDFESSSRAVFWTYIANTFAISGNALSKISMGLFLLRVVQLTWHKIAITSLLIITTGTSMTLIIMVWNQTDPINASWDPIRVKGIWKLDLQPLGVGLGGMTQAPSLN